MIFHPCSFWHTADWESSTTNERDGYVRDDVLYVGDLDEVVDRLKRNNIYFDEQT